MSKGATAAIMSWWYVLKIGNKADAVASLTDSSCKLDDERCNSNAVGGVKAQSFQGFGSIYGGAAAEKNISCHSEGSALEEAFQVKLEEFVEFCLLIVVETDGEAKD
eukprot:5509433-Ditylum_brightwellii.AAC.1